MSNPSVTPKAECIESRARRMARVGFQAVTWLPVPIACHVGYSWIGFNPTDDGWLPAVARRLAEGEVPHRDFIFVRPVFSALLQIPLVHWGGEHVIWLSRLWGWLTLGAVCWIWTSLLAREASPPLRYVCYVVSLLFCAHTFPIMGWHTIDGLLFCTIAVALLTQDTPARRSIAFFTAGTAALCRQNFALFPPLLLLAVGGGPKTWFSAGIWSALPSAIYIGLIALLGGGSDFFEQFWAAGGSLSEVAVHRYLRDPLFWIGLVAGLGIAAVLALLGQRLAAYVRIIPTTLFLMLTACAAGLLWYGPTYYPANTITLFGLILGLSVILLLRGVSVNDRLILISVLGLAWVSAISIGYHTPGLMSGVLLLGGWRLLHLLARTSIANPPATVSMLLSAIAVSFAFSHARHTFPYRDRSSTELTFEAGLALDGATGLRTNGLTYATLADLSALMRRFNREGRNSAVLTDCAAVWIRSPNPNPLPCDWPQGIELGYRANLMRRMTDTITNMPGDSRIIVQKYLISDYDRGGILMPKDASYYYIQNWVARHCERVLDTPFFTVYSPPLLPLKGSRAP
jgi:hypothetical protein